jgi:hypothetical protein
VPGPAAVLSRTVICSMPVPVADTSVIAAVTVTRSVPE